MKPVYIIALIAALVAALASFLFVQDLTKNSKIENADTTKVFVAVQDVPDGTVIDNNNFGTYFDTQSIVDKFLTPGYIAEDEVANVIGRVSTRTIYAGEQLSMNSFATQSSSEIDLAYKLNEGEVAYTLKADATTGVDGYIRIGDTVDILANYTLDEEAAREAAEAQGKKYVRPTTPYNTVNIGDTEYAFVNLTYHEFKNLEVLAIATSGTVEAAKAEGTVMEDYTSITVRVDKDMAEDLFRMEENSSGQMDSNYKIILNSRADASKTTDGND